MKKKKCKSLWLLNELIEHELVILRFSDIPKLLFMNFEEKKKDRE